jgi:Uma2 family endonuclease
MALVKTVRPRVSYTDLCQQPEDGRRYEIYDGEVFVVPSPLPLHQIVAMNIYDWLRYHPRTQRGFVAAAPLDIVFTEYNVVQPDVLYFEPERLRSLSPRAVIRTPPDLAIEVLSPSTESTDRGRKMQVLARFRVREYWLVDPEAQRIEVHSLADEGFRLAQVVGDDDGIESPLLGRLGGRARDLFKSPI